MNKHRVRRLFGALACICLVFFLTWFFTEFVGQRTEVEGMSMSPTLKDKENLILDKISYRFRDPKRYEIVVFPPKYKENTYYIKRVIGLPGDTIQYDNDTLYINGKKTNEPYLKDYIARFKKDKLQSTYTGKGFEENGELFRQLANTAQAFTVDKDGNPKFTLKLLDDEYLLLGDDRIVSKDSRQVGAFKKEQIKGQAVFRLWPIYPFKTY